MSVINSGSPGPAPIKVTRGPMVLVHRKPCAMVFSIKTGRKPNLNALLRCTMPVVVPDLHQNNAACPGFAEQSGPYQAAGWRCRRGAIFSISPACDPRVSDWFRRARIAGAATPRSAMAGLPGRGIFRRCCSASPPAGRSVPAGHVTGMHYAWAHARELFSTILPQPVAGRIPSHRLPRLGQANLINTRSLPTPES